MYYLNGIISEKELSNEDFFYGYSLFETMYGLKGKILFLEEHLTRLTESAKLIGISIDFELEKKIFDFIKQFNEIEEFMIKIQVSQNSFYMKIEKFKGRTEIEGIKGEFIKDYYQNELGYLKSGNYLGNILARRKLNGFEGIFSNRDGIITEGTISNVFFLKNNIVYTPSLELNILPGITRNKIINLCKKIGFEVQEGYFSKENILDSDGIFFTNSLMKMGLLWVSEFENIKKNKTKEIHKLEKEYYKLTNDMI